MNPPDLEKAWDLPPSGWTAGETLALCGAAVAVFVVGVLLWEKWGGGHP